MIIILLAILLLQLVILGSLIWSQISWISRLNPEQLEWEMRRRGMLKGGGRLIQGGG